MFRALMIDNEGGEVRHAIKEISENSLPEGDVLVAVEYSTLNYKDGLVLKGLGNLVKRYPHVPGVDFVGTVIEGDGFQPGDKVVQTGWRVGELHWGGYAEKARVRREWLLPLPPGLSARDSMVIGTAGLSAMLSIMALEEQGLRPNQGPVLVTGATGGVGSVATAILANLGYEVVASTGKLQMRDYLLGLGAQSVIDRQELATPTGKPLESEKWAGCVDSVGGPTLARVLAQMQYGASVAAVGLAGGNKLEATVIPFLLRGVRLIGVDSVLCPNERRLDAWKRIITDLPMEKLRQGATEVGLPDLPALADRILKGEISGRVVVDVKA